MTQPITFACVVLSTLQQRRCAGLMLLHMLHASIRCLPGNFGLQRVSLINLDGRVSLGRWNFNREIPCTVNKNTPPRNNMEAKQTKLWNMNLLFKAVIGDFFRFHVVIFRGVNGFRGRSPWSPSQESCIHPVANFKKNDRGWDLWEYGDWSKWMGSIWMFPKIVGFPPKSSILIGFSIINHPFWGTPIFGNTHLYLAFLR